MKIAVGIVASVCALAFLGDAAAPASAGQGAIGGLVSSIRDVSGNPVQGALVVTVGAVTRQAVTNSAGIVTILGLPAGTYSVRVTRSGFAPFGQLVKVGAQENGIKTLNVTFLTESFANAADGSSGATSVPVNGNDAPYVAPALTAALSANVLTTAHAIGAAAGGAPALEGMRSDETRLELDGIPLAPGPLNGAALQFRAALTLDDIAFVEGPSVSSESLQNAIGGIVDYRTPQIATKLTSGYDTGYDSTFGAFGHARYSDTFGKIGVLVDTFDGASGAVSSTVKAQLDLSRATSIALATYETRGSVVGNTSTLTDSAPADAVDLRTMFGTGTFRGRFFTADSNASSQLTGTAASIETSRAQGYTFAYDIPFGENLATVGYDRRYERLALPGVPDVTDAAGTLRLATDLQLSKLTRLALGDDLDSGTQLSHRNDPQIALSIRPGSALALRFAAGSAYENQAQAGPAETSFGYRASADITTHAGDVVKLAAFELRTFDDYADLADARSSGVELGFDRQSLPGRLGIDGGVDFTRTYAYGAQQPLARYESAAQVIDGAQQAGNPFTKARLALTYRDETTEFRLGTTLIGSNNALSDRAVALGDLSMRVPLLPIGDLRIGIENLFGQTILDPELAPLYPPHELTVTLQRN